MPLPAPRQFKQFEFRLSFFNRPEIHSVDHLGTTSFRGSDFRRNPLKAASARSEENCSSERGSNPDNKKYRIKPNQPEKIRLSGTWIRSRIPLHDIGSTPEAVRTIPRMLLRPWLQFYQSLKTNTEAVLVSPSAGTVIQE
jgi:hypothetical protein